jgi:hypothetical protein
MSDWDKIKQFIGEGMQGFDDRLRGGVTAVADEAEKKLGEFATGLSGSPGTPYGEAVNAGLAGARSLIPWRGNYEQELDQVRQDRESQGASGAYSVIPEVKRKALMEANRRDIQGMGPGMVAQVAYHGTPAVFNKFSLKHAGEGEGTSGIGEDSFGAFGHGLYFAENPKVSESYREKLSQAEKLMIGGKEFNSTYKSPHYDVSNAIKKLEERTRDFPEDVFQLTLEYEKKAREKEINSIKEAARLFPRNAFSQEALNRVDGISSLVSQYEDMIKNKQRPTIEKPQGEIHQVDIPENSSLFDYDSAFSGQPTSVKNKFLSSKFSEAAPLTSEKLIGDEYGSTWDPDGSELYSEVSRELGSDKKASELFGKIGIPGLRYLDGISRRKGNGSHDFVIWDDSKIKNLAKSDSLKSLLEMLETDPNKRP